MLLKKVEIGPLEMKVFAKLEDIFFEKSNVYRANTTSKQSKFKKLFRKCSGEHFEDPGLDSITTTIAKIVFLNEKNLLNHLVLTALILFVRLVITSGLNLRWHFASRQKKYQFCLNKELTRVLIFCGFSRQYDTIALHVT